MMYKPFKLNSLITLVLLMIIASSCKKEEIKDLPIAHFHFVINPLNFYEVIFTNTSQQADNYKWDFGDSHTSTEENPVHIYSSDGTYTVRLTAINETGDSASYSEVIYIASIEPPYNILAGYGSKEWRFLRDGTNALGVSPNAGSFGLWWGLANDGSSPCVFKQTWTFNINGTFDFDDAGQMWGEVHVFEGTAVYETCFEAIPANMVNKDGADVSAWLSDTHNFDYDPFEGKLTVSGEGAWMGNIKVTPEGDVAVPQSSITYDISIVQGSVCDTMLISLTHTDWYRGFKYVSYHNPADEPDLVE
jgi:PKD repeat protein